MKHDAPAKASVPKGVSVVHSFRAERLAKRAALRKTLQDSRVALQDHRSAENDVASPGRLPSIDTATMAAPVAALPVADLGEASIFAGLLRQSRADEASPTCTETTDIAFQVVMPGSTMDLACDIADPVDCETAVTTDFADPPSVDINQPAAAAHFGPFLPASAAAAAAADTDHAEDPAAKTSAAEDAWCNREMPPEADKPADGSSPTPLAAAAAASLMTTLDLGPAMAARLKIFGIHDAADVANADAEVLQRELGDISRLVDVASWIARARLPDVPMKPTMQNAGPRERLSCRKSGI